jgi:hypothetical protein
MEESSASWPQQRISRCRQLHVMRDHRPTHDSVCNRDGVQHIEKSVNLDFARRQYPCCCHGDSRINIFNVLNSQFVKQRGCVVFSHCQTNGFMFAELGIFKIFELDGLNKGNHKRFGQSVDQVFLMPRLCFIQTGWRS